MVVCTYEIVYQLKSVKDTCNMRQMNLFRWSRLIESEKLMRDERYHVCIDQSARSQLQITIVLRKVYEYLVEDTEKHP